MRMTVPARLVAATLAMSAAAVSAQAAERHNGTWSVELVTESGLCNARYTYAVAIRDGEVRALTATAGTRVSGRVASDGTVGIAVANAAATGTGTGRLDGMRGSGTWNVSSLCTGRWTARRSDARTAQAD